MSFLTKINGTSGAIETNGSKLDINATSLVLPNRTSGSDNAGAMYFDTTSNSFQGYNGTDWVTIQSGLQNSSGSTKVEIGASSNDIVFTNNSSESMRVIANGNVGIGTTNPQKALHVVGDVKLDLMSGFESVGTLTIGRPSNIRQHSLTFNNSNIFFN